MTSGRSGFRPGRLLSTRFTGTLSERYGEPVERIPTPERLGEWLALNGLAVESCDADGLGRARELREAVHVVATAAATGEDRPGGAVGTLNERSAGGRAAAVLTPDGGRAWTLGPRPGVDDALSVIAADAIEVVSGERDGRLALCASPTCRAVFLDTSQSRSRRWCDMNTCGNREKKARFRAHRAGS